MFQNLSATVIPAADLAPQDIETWQAIADNPATRSPFFAPEFAQAVARSGADVRVAIIRSGREPVAYFPFQFATPWHRLVGAAERVGGHLSDYFGVIARPGLSVTPAQLLSLSRLNAMNFSHLDEHQCAIGLTGEKPETGLQTDMSAGWTAYWGQRRADDRTFVVDTERRWRKLNETVGPTRLVFDCRDGAELTQLIAAKRTQYLKTNVDDALASEWTRTLCARLLEARSPQCSGLLSVLYAGDTWVAAHFGLRSGDVLHHWFPVYNPELAKVSPGRLLLRAMLECAEEHGIRTVDYGAGDQAYKREFATTEYRIYRGQWYRPNVSAFGFRVAQSLAWRLRAPSAPKAASA